MKSTNETYNELLNLLKNEQHSLSFYLSRHVTQEEKYKTVEYDLSVELKKWLINHIFEEIKMIGIENLEKIQISTYNHEFNINDSIAELLLTAPEFSDVEKTNKLLLDSISKAKKNESIVKSNFQIVKILSKGEVFYTCYYKGIKKSGKKKKYLGIIGGNVEENTESFFDIGGNLSFVIYKDQIFIFRVKDFEYAYKYTSHITKKRDENINKIIGMNIFTDAESSNIFKEKSSNHLYARGLAEIKDEQLQELKSNYQDRCRELKIIKESLDSGVSKEDELREANGVLLDLLEFINFENDNRIEIKKEMNITSLLHFIQDKIVKSFLTEKIRTIIGYQKG